VKAPLLLATPGRPTNRLLLSLACLLTLTCQAAEPAANVTGNAADLGACGDAVRSLVLKQKTLGTIREEVLRRTAPDPVTVEEQDLQIQACPDQTADSEFVIKRTEYDAARDLTIFWLSSSQKGTVLPSLMVTVHKQRSIKVLVARHELHNGQAVSMDDLVETTQASGNLLLPAAALQGTLPNPVRADPATKEPASKTNPHSILLVKVGMPSVLVTRGKNFRGSMTVIPLESGTRGQELRVRDPGTRQVLRATVANVNQLEKVY
jgi:flagella basal body P-ring formation protein FlgA